MVLVTLRSEPSAKEVFSVKTVRELRITVESKHKVSGQVSQCHRYQRCEKGHHTVSCKKRRDSPVRCAYCEAVHQAKYS